MSFALSTCSATDLKFLAEAQEALLQPLSLLQKKKKSSFFSLIGSKLLLRPPLSHLSPWMAVSYAVSGQ